MLAMTARGLKRGGKKIDTVEQDFPLGSPVLAKDLIFRTVRVVFFTLNSLDGIGKV